MSNFKGRCPPMGSKTDFESETLSKIDESVVCSLSSLFKELGELSLRVHAGMARGSSNGENIFEGSSGKESNVPSHSGTGTSVSCSSASRDSHPHDDKVSSMNFISDASVRPKTYVKKDESARGNISLKDVEKNIMHSKDTGCNIRLNKNCKISKKRVSFASDGTHEGEYERHVLFSPSSSNINCFPGTDYRQFESCDDSYSFSDSFLRLPGENSAVPHKRWYPLPSYKSSHNNAATQTSKKARTSLDINVDVEETISVSPRHLHVKETFDIHPIDRLQEWQVHVDIDVRSPFASNFSDHDIKQYSNRPVKAQEFVPTRVAYEADVAMADDVATADDVDVPNDHFDDDKEFVLHGIFRNHEKDGQESEKKIFKSASTQTNNCDCFIQLKNMLMEALDQVPVEDVSAKHKVLKKQLEIQSERRSLRSESFDKLFLGENNPFKLIADNSPQYFNSTLMSSLCKGKDNVNKCKDVERLPKKKKVRSMRQIVLEKSRQEERTKVLKKMFRSAAKEFSKQIARSLVDDGKVNYGRHERVLKNLY